MKIYVTCNILPHNAELAALPAFLEFCQAIGVDAFIMTDLGVMSMAKKYAPNVAIHISTQAGVVNYETANAFYNMGAERVVLARELSFEEIAEIRAKTPRRKPRRLRAAVPLGLLPHRAHAPGSGVHDRTGSEIDVCLQFPRYVHDRAHSAAHRMRHFEPQN